MWDVSCRYVLPICHSVLTSVMVLFFPKFFSNLYVIKFTIIFLHCLCILVHTLKAFFSLRLLIILLVFSPCTFKVLFLKVKSLMLELWWYCVTTFIFPNDNQFFQNYFMKKFTFSSTLKGHFYHILNYHMCLRLFLYYLCFSLC